MKQRVLFSQKLVPFLQSELKGSYSGKYLRKLLESNGCRVNGRVERFGSAQLQKGDLVELAPGFAIPKERRFHWETLYEDAETRWVNKPAGWVSSEEACQKEFGQGIYLLHRLDKETTGVLGLAKGEEARQKWCAFFAERKIEKRYLAAVDGVPRERRGVQETFLQRKRSFQGQTIWGSGREGLKAITHWERLQEGRGAAILQCQPITGRTHQIRVHLAEMGHPILINRQYAEKFSASFFARRPLLHALEVHTPYFQVKAPLPEDFQEVLFWINQPS